MKTLNEILDEVCDGGRPDYEDLRYALVAMKALHNFDHKAIMNLWIRERDGKYNPKLFGLEWQVNESFNRFKTALNLPPKQYVGTSHDPDTEECQRWRRISNGILKAVIDKQKGEVK